MAEYVDDLVEDLPGDDRGVCLDGPVQIVDGVGEQLIDRYPDDFERHESDDDE